MLTSAAIGVVSHLQDLPNYLPSFDYFQGNDNEDDLSSQNHHDSSAEQKHNSEDKLHDENESESERGDSDQKDKESDQSKEDEGDDQSMENEDDSSKEGDEDNESEPKLEKPESQERSGEPKDASKNSQADTSKPEESPEPGLVEKFQKYYSYAKPLVKLASTFFPLTAPFRNVMLAIEMVDLAYQTSVMYTEGEGMLSIGYFVGKETISRLVRQ